MCHFQHIRLTKLANLEGREHSGDAPGEVVEGEVGPGHREVPGQ